MNIAKAIQCAILAKEVYHDFSDAKFGFSEFSDAEFGLVQDPVTDTQCAWLYEPDKKEMFLVFRGTEKNTDWKTNVTFSRDLFQIKDTSVVSASATEVVEEVMEDTAMVFNAPSGDFDTFDSPVEETQSEDDGFGVAPAVASGSGQEAEGMQIVPVTDDELAPALVNNLTGERDLAPSSPRAQMHLGFVTAYMSVQDRIHEAVDQFRPERLTVTGHSLGGALATLGAIDFALTHIGKYDIELYTFGSPRVGNEDFKTLFDKHIPRTFRFVNGLDIVTAVPRTWQGYHHVGNEIRIGVRWSWRFLSKRVSDHFMLQYIPALEALK
jgi:hypothetical protein